MACATAMAVHQPIHPAVLSPPKGAWVIYDERSDHVFGGHFVARKFRIGKVFTFTTDDELIAPTLSDLRKLLPAGLINIGRNGSDPQNVVETWV